MTIAESPLSALPRDLHSLLTEYRQTILPTAQAYLGSKVSANQLRGQWKPYYFGSFHSYAITVERAWREATGTDGSLESGAPWADPVYEVPLKHFPVCVAHNNLDRLVEVLAAELGEQTADKAEIQERTGDLAQTVEALDSLMESLAEQPATP
ncbi:MAG TPA: hypothetical protein VE465_27660 [Streptosporangiaceae bacterium]|jgi:hypothetical protein|nr:hypothetical protein [Streptosporangiaceae bacterium]